MNNFNIDNPLSGLGEHTINLDFIYSENPAVLDMGIRNAIKGIDLSTLAIGIGLARVKSEKLFLKLNYKNISSYIKSLCEPTNREESSIFNWLKIGETYIKYREELEEIGFTDKNSPTKLPFLEKALAVNDKKEVYSNLLSMSQRDFAKYAKPKESEPPEEAPVYEVHGNIIYYKGQWAAQVSTKIEPKAADMYIRSLIAASRALEAKGRIVAVHLRNSREVNHFLGEAKKSREKIRRELRKRKKQKKRKAAAKK